MFSSQTIALVTGAGSGIGRAVAQGLAAQGMFVCLMGRREERLQQTLKLMTAAGGKGACYPGDVGVLADVEALVPTIAMEHGPVTVLINNAAYFPENISTHEQTPGDWDRVLTTNLRGPFLLTRAVLPEMIRQNSGRIVNVSAPIKHMPQAAAYSCSKSALDALTKATAFEHRDKNIVITAIEPPYCDTEMHTGGASPEVVVPTILRLVDESTPVRTGRIVKIDSQGNATGI